MCCHSPTSRWDGAQRLRLEARLPTFKRWLLLSQLSAWVAPLWDSPCATGLWGEFVDYAQIEASE